MTKKSKGNGKFDGATHIMFVLDESGSMGMVWDATIDGFNEWLSTMKRDDGNISFTLIKFDTQYRPLEENVPIKDVKDLDRTRYSPNANTALYDAIGHCVNVVDPKVGKKDRALVVILTDGQENSSREMTRASVETLVKDREGRGNWTFTYLSAHPNAFADSASMGMRAGNTAVFAATPTGTQSAMRRVANATLSYSSGGSASTDSFYRPDDADSADLSAKRESPLPRSR